MDLNAINHWLTAIAFVVMITIIICMIKQIEELEDRIRTVELTLMIEE